LASAALVAAGCATTAKREAVKRTPGCRPGSVRALGSPARAYAAALRRAAPAYRAPGVGPIARFRRDNAYGFRTIFSVRAAVLRGDCRATWYRVQLPIKPNGVTGYVRPAAVSVQKVNTRIAVDLSRRELLLYRSGRLVLRTQVAVGSSSTPTPIGRYYVEQRIRTTDPAGPFGPGVLAVSAFSNVLTDWPLGGPIGIHGTNAPWTIGQAASHGCIRVPNETLARLFEATAGGTPVVIHP
jgi:lipoprotein-anchoring transpeptidase ErfK/SrfK